MSDRNFAERWRMDLQRGVPGVQLVEVEHPLEVYVGSSDLGRARLQIRSHKEAHMPELSELILVNQAQTGGIHTLTMTLLDDAYVNIFMALAEDVIARTRHAHDEVDALNRAAAIVEQWQRLLKRRPLRRLTLEALRGLVGELWLVLHHFSQGRTVNESLLGWQGPLGLPQDFWYPNSGFHEAKSIGPSATKVQISSAQQLDQADMELLVLRVAQVSEDSSGAVTLRGLVDQATSVLKSEGHPDDDLVMRLKHLSVDLDDPFYHENFFTIDTVTSYTVTAEFPAIRASELPLAVDLVRYSLTVSALEDHKSGTPLAPDRTNRI